MEKYIAILRGINVSGKHKIRMADLKEKLSSLHYSNINTYIQSGNVVFEYKKMPDTHLAQQISDLILQHYGFHVPVIVLGASELSRIVSNNPFTAPDIDKDKLHVTFLAKKPTQETLHKLSLTPDSADEWKAGERHIYLYCPNGYGRTKLSNTFFEQKLKVTATTRNWKTVNKLVELANPY